MTDFLKWFSVNYPTLFLVGLGVAAVFALIWFVSVVITGGEVRLSKSDQGFRFPGVRILFGNHPNRAWVYDDFEEIIAPDPKDIAECKQYWELEIDRVRNDRRDMMKIYLNPHCREMSDEYSAMWIDIAKAVLTDGGLVLWMYIPPIQAHAVMLMGIKGAIVTAARTGKKSIPVRIISHIQETEHEIASLAKIQAKETIG